MKELLLIEGLNLSELIEEYRLFFLGLLPSMFIVAILVEYFGQMEAFALVKRALVSIVILTSVTSFYESSIKASLTAANKILEKQKNGNLLLMDMLNGTLYWKAMRGDKKEKAFYREKNLLTKALSFIKYNLFETFVNDAFTVTVYFLVHIFFLIIKVIYSLVYYLGYGLIGIPCLLYLLPSMGNVLRGGILSYLWCLILPHVLVFVISMIGTEINHGHTSGQIIGGSLMGTCFLFILALFVVFTPVVAMMILSGSGIAQAGSLVSALAGHYVMKAFRGIPSRALRTGQKIWSRGMMLTQGFSSQGINSSDQTKGIKSFYQRKGSQHLFKGGKAQFQNQELSKTHHQATNNPARKKATQMEATRPLKQEMKGLTVISKGVKNEQRLSRHRTGDERDKNSHHSYRRHRSHRSSHPAGKRPSKKRGR